MGHGTYISQAERTRLKAIVGELVTKFMLPWAENRAKRLTAYHTPKKLFSIFSNAETLVRPPTEKPGKPEWEIRLAADLSFLTQDYPNAFVNYKRLLEKIQKTASAEEIGSCKEFMALSSLMSDNNVKDFKKNMEAVVQLYEKANAFTLIVRNSLFVSDILLSIGAYTDAGEYTARASQMVVREGELAAVLLEQTAFCNVREPVPRLRKFAHYMVYAGTFYFEQALVGNAVFCLGTSYRVYQKPNWPQSLVYLCSRLGNALLTADDLEHSFIFYRKLLQVAIDWKGESQDAFLKLFLQSADRLKGKIMADESLSAEAKQERARQVLHMHNSLEISLNSVELFAAQDQVYCNDKNRLFAGLYDKPLIAYRQEQTEEENLAEGEPNNAQEWQSLGKMFDSSSGLGEDTLDPQREETLRDLLFYDERVPKRKAAMYCTTPRVLHASEPLLLKVVCKNPLGTELQLTKLQIFCHYVDNTPNIEIENKAMTLKAYERKEIVLSALPKAEGELCVEGVEWEVSNLITGRFALSQLTNEATPMVLVVRPQAGLLKLEANKCLRTRYLNGELDSYTLTLKNEGTLPISKISLQTDFPLILGWKRMDLDWTLKPKEAKELTLNVRVGFVESVARSESLLPRVLIRYLGDSEKGHYRYARIEHCFSVIAPFCVKKQFSQSYRHLNEYLLNIQITKLYNKNEGFALKELCVIGDGWKLQEKERFTGFDKVHNTFVSLTQAAVPVPLSGRRVMFESGESAEDATLAEPYVNYIREVQDARNRKYRRLNENDVIVDLLAIWTLFVNKKAYNGVHIISIDINSCGISSIPHTPKQNVFPLQVVHECEGEVAHNFARNPLCRVPLKLVLKNTSRHAARFRFEALGIQRSAKDEGFAWQGQVSKNFKGLEPNEQYEIVLSACVIAPGVYDLNRFSFTFYRNSSTNMDLDPSEVDIKNVIVDVYQLEFVQILTRVSNESQ